MPSYVITTDRGQVVFRAAAPWPRLVFVHGFMRRPEHLGAWLRRTPGAGLLCLPGHNQAPELDQVSMAAWIEAWTEALGRWPTPPVVIGESLGAILAMSVPATAVVAVEPPLSVDDLWPLRREMAQARSRGLQIEDRYMALFDEPFDWVLDRISAPTLVIAGDEPLSPPRPVHRSPSLLNDRDFAAYAAHPLVEAHRIAGGHTLMDDNPEGVLQLVRRFLGPASPVFRPRTDTIP